MRICREFYFDAAHRLENYKGSCENLHGHTYKLEVVVCGKQKENGMIIDFNELKMIIQETVIEKLDHSNLNDLFDTPTAENIAAWIYNRLRKELRVCSVKLWEGNGKWVEVNEK